MKSLLRSFALILLFCPLVWAAKAPVITTIKLPQGQTTVSYTGGNVYGKWGTKPYTFSVVSGSLPTGLSLATVSSVGKITGTPSVTGTFSFKIRLTDSAGSPKTYDQQLYILITGSAAPPVTPVQITTATPLPNGLVSSAYNTTLQAIYGTATYSWSMSSGLLPAGLALAASTGVVSGTPTALGTYYFTIKVTDSSSPATTAQQNFYLTVNNPSPAPAYIFSDGFESGDFSAFNYNTTNSSVQSVTKYAGTYAMRTDYYICNDFTNPACGALHQDNGGYVRKFFNAANGYPTGIGEFYFRGFVRMHVCSASDATCTQTAAGTVLAGLGRKFWYFQDSDTDLWHFIMGTVIGESSGLQYYAFAAPVGSKGGTFCELNTISTRAAAQCGTLVGSSRSTTQYYWVPDAWYYVELHAKLNTPASVGPYDGVIQLWIQKTGVDPSPVLVIDASGLNIRGAITTGMGKMQIGDQVDRQNGQLVNEIRFWDDLRLSGTGPIGP